jgi:DNA-binding LacI/PurR family transcriptional regulator
MTGFAFPEMLVGVCERFFKGEKEAAEDLYDAYLPVVRHEQQPGIGNFEIDESCVPALTTVEPAPHQIGRAAAAIVKRALAGGDRRETIIIEPVLLVRQSTVR